MSVTIEGMDEVREILRTIAPNQARNLIRTTVQGLATEIAKKSQERAPVGFSGRVRKGHKAKRRRQRGDEQVSEVHIEGAFYWRFQEYGTQDVPEQPFVRPAVDAVLADIEGAFRRRFGQQLEKALKRAAKKAAKAAQP